MTQTQKKEPAERRVLKKGEKMEVGRFYAGNHSYYWAPISHHLDHTVSVQVAYRPGDGEGWRVLGCRPWTKIRRHDLLWLTVKDWTSVWEITREEYRRIVGHVPKAVPDESIWIEPGPRACPGCDEPVVGVNRWITLFDDGRSVPEVLRRKEPEKMLTTVFSGCAACLERRFADDPVALALLKAFLSMGR